jgi:hypothetical protein
LREGELDDCKGKESRSRRKKQKEDEEGNQLLLVFVVIDCSTNYNQYSAFSLKQ